MATNIKLLLLSNILCLWTSFAWAFPPGFVGAVASGRGSLNLIPEAARNDLTNAFWGNASHLTINDANTVTYTSIIGRFYSGNLTVDAASTYIFSQEVSNCTATSPSYAIYNVSAGSWIVSSGSVMACGATLNKTFTTPVGCTAIRVYPANTASTTGSMDLSNISVIKQ